MINQQTEARIKAAARIEDVLTDQGVTLHKQGAQMVGLCPFHDDHTQGSFVVSPSKNICSCYSCGAVGIDPIDALIRLKYASMPNKEAYPQALRYLAAMYNIYVDEEQAPTVEHKRPILPPPPVKQTIMWTAELMKPFVQFNHKNPLITYLNSLPLMQAHKEQLTKAVNNYLIGTYPSGYHEGWTIWWYVDQLGYVRSGKMMKYKADGHRDKETNSTWVHKMLAKQGKYNEQTHQPDLNCLFGQHLIDHCPNAYIRIVESEKTALICSAFTKPREVLWLATGGLSMMTDAKLLTLLNKGRYVELYPDYDGYPQWEEKIQKSKALAPFIENGMLTISQQVRELHTEADGPKADIADIMIRLITTPQTTLGQKVAARLNAPSKANLLDELINKLNLTEI